MATQSRFSINGLIDTSKTVLDNIQNICNSSGCWFTFDSLTGKWSVVINQPGDSVKSFDHSNIIGGIKVSGTGLRDMYNGVRVTYPRTDIRDNQDFVQIQLPASELNPNEVENILEINYDLVNTQVQSQLLGFRELKQSRVNKTITFDTDYSSLGLRAGDIIDITSDIMDMDAELYRIVEVSENDTGDTGITLNITAIFYDPNVYNEDDLYEYTITTENGIVSAGAIGKPDTPQVTKYEKDSRPRLEIETIVPSGRVEAMEFWMAVGNSSSTYSLVGTQKDTNNDLLNEGQEVVLDLDNINAANVYVKTRGINSTTAGPFSDVSSLISYQPLQTTDAVTDNTSVLDEFGNILPLLGTAAMLSLLNGLIQGDSGPNTIIGNLANAGLGSAFSNVYVTSNGISTTLTATGQSTLSIIAGDNISLSANSATKELTITSSADGTWQGAHKFVSFSQPANAVPGDVWFKLQ